MAHPCHEFPRIRARIGGELVAGMAQVVNVDACHADRGERRNPDPPPESGDCPRPGRRQKPRPTGRKPTGAAGRRRAAVPASLRAGGLLAVTQVSGTALSRSVRVRAVQGCRRFSRRGRTPSRALPAVASLRDDASATLDCALHGKPIGTYQVGREDSARLS